MRVGHTIPRMTRLLCAVAAGLLVFSACSAPPADPAFVGARSEAVDCADGLPGCLRVFSAVDGTRAGTGSCILYATTGPGRVAVAASGELDLVPGTTAEWIVPIPSHFDVWNPVCAPTAES